MTANFLSDSSTMLAARCRREFGQPIGVPELLHESKLLLLDWSKAKVWGVDKNWRQNYNTVGRAYREAIFAERESVLAY